MPIEIGGEEVLTGGETSGRKGAASAGGAARTSTMDDDPNGGAAAPAMPFPDIRDKMAVSTKTGTLAASLRPNCSPWARAPTRLDGRSSLASLDNAYL